MEHRAGRDDIKSVSFYSCFLKSGQFQRPQGVKRNACVAIRGLYSILSCGIGSPEPQKADKRYCPTFFMPFTEPTSPRGTAVLKTPIMENQEQSGSQQQQQQTVIIQQPQKQVSESNGMGTAGFVLSVVTLFFGWIPVLGWILWIVGLILSCVGLTKEPKGLAITGVAISLGGLILLLTVFSAIYSAFH